MRVRVTLSGVFFGDFSSGRSGKAAIWDAEVITREFTYTEVRVDRVYGLDFIPTVWLIGRDLNILTEVLGKHSQHCQGGRVSLRYDLNTPPKVQVDALQPLLNTQPNFGIDRI